MRKRKKLLSLFLCACMAVTALTGCSGKGDETGADGTVDGVTDETGGEPGNADAGSSGDAKGRFLETEVELPGKVSSVIGARGCGDGSVVLIGYDENEAGLYMERLESQGEDWEEIPLDSGNYMIAAINTDGSAALFGYKNEIGLVSADGGMSKLTFELPDYEGDADDRQNFILAAGYAADKLFLVDLNHRLYEVDTESGAMNAVPQTSGETISGLIALDNQLVLLTRNGVRLMDAADHTILEDTVLADSIGVLENNTDTPIYPVMFTEGESAQELYYVSHDGIFYHKQGGSAIEQLANGELLSIGDGSVSFREFVWFDDEHFMVFAADSLGTEHCYSYAYDADASAVPEKQLSVYALEDSVVLQQAVSAFQKQHQDVFVKKTIGMSGDDGVTADDAVKALNTQIMAGSGPDVLVLDGLPADSYVEKGILADIGDLVADADRADGLFTNITGAFATDNAVYQVPLRFYCTFADKNEGVGELSGSPQQLASSLQPLKGGETPVFAPLAAEQFLYTLFDVYSASWKTADGIDEDALRGTLEAAKTLYDLDGYAGQERAGYAGSWDTLYQGQSIYGSIGAGSSMRIMGGAQVSLGTVNGVSDVRDLYGQHTAKAGSFELLSGEGKKTFLPFVSLGLAEGAKDNEMAKDFIRLALSADVQQRMTNGFSVNKAAFAYECENGKEYSIGSSGPNGENIGYEVERLDAAHREALMAMLEGLEAPVWNDRVVMEFVIGEGKSYLTGEKSLEDAVSAITQKVRLYVSE